MEAVSKLPKLTIYMPKALRAQLRAAAMLQGKSVWEVVNTAVKAYLQSLPTEQRFILESMARELQRPEKP